MWGTTLRVIKGDTRSSDNGSYVQGDMGCRFFERSA